MEVMVGKVKDRKIAFYLFSKTINVLNANVLIINMKFLREILVIYLYLEVIHFLFIQIAILIKAHIHKILEHFMNNQHCQQKICLDIKISKY